MRRAAVCMARTVLLLAVGWTDSVEAGGVRDLADAWLIPAPRVGELLDAGAAARPGWSVHVAQGHLFGLDELPQLGVVAGRVWAGVAGRLSWERLGRSLYREDQGRVELLVGGGWRLGGEVGIDRLALAGGESRNVATADLRIRGVVGDRMLLDVWWPITAAPPWYGEQGLRRWLRLCGGHDGWTWAAVADRRVAGGPVIQGEVLLRLAPAAALGLRLEPWSGAAGLVTAWRLGAVLLRTSHLVHSDLGATHRWSLGVEAGL